jgi:hypothetical protein
VSRIVLGWSKHELVVEERALPTINELLHSRQIPLIAGGRRNDGRDCKQFQSLLRIGHAHCTVLFTSEWEVVRPTLYQSVSDC